MSTEFDFTHNTTRFDLKNAYCLARASELAYEKKEKIEETVARWGFQKFRFYDMDGTQGFTMSNDKIIVTAFRGTEMKIEDWMTDLNFDLVNGPMDGRVHKGFYESIKEVWSSVERTLARFRENKPKSLWFTGHSLGAALAALAVALLRDQDHPLVGLKIFLSGEQTA